MKIIKNFRCIECGVYYTASLTAVYTDKETNTAECNCGGIIKITNKPLVVEE